jgi:hypothetical protein
LEDPIGNCERLVGGVKVSVVWVTEQGVGQVSVPEAMYHPGKDLWFYKQEGETDEQAWNRFASLDFFNLLNMDGNPAPLDNKSMYFLPACSDEDIQIGDPGGGYFALLSERPVLVQ